MNKIKILLIFSIIFILLFCSIKLVYSIESVPTISEDSKKEKYELKINEHPLNIEQILGENTKDVLEEELVLEEMDLEYSTIYKENSELPSGTIYVTQIGVTGKQDTIIRKKYKNSELYSEEIIANNIKRASIDKVVEIGVGKGNNNYKIRKNDVVYITPSFLKVMMEPNINSRNIITLVKGDEIQVVEIYDDSWCYIVKENFSGYVLSEGLSNINPLKSVDEQFNFSDNELSKPELLNGLNIDMDVSVPSGLSVEQFRKVLQNNPRDKNNIFTENADYFYYAEQEYGINGLFLAAIAIHESGYGTSSIAVNKNNLFGYMAYDNSPYASAKTFDSYSEGIDLVARVLIKYYLNEKGTSIYGGEVADGRYYSGKTIKCVNKYYATDTNWSNAVYNHMKALYESL